MENTLSVPRSDGDADVGHDVGSEQLTELLGAARKILQSDDLAWDAVQEALWTLASLSRAPENRSRWLRSAVIHRSLKIARSERRRRRHERAAAVEERCPACSPDRRAEVQELSENVADAFDSLCPEHRRILLLTGKDYATISGELEISLGTVRSRMSRARAALRERLGRELMVAES